MSGLAPGPRCRARMGYRVQVQQEGHRIKTERRSARCHLEEGHAGTHRCTIPVPGKRGRLIDFREGAPR